MEDFNSQYANHSKLEQLKQFILEHGTYIELKKGEQFTIQGKVNHRGAYIEHGLLRYTRVDEKREYTYSRIYFLWRIYRKFMHTYST